MTDQFTGTKSLGFIKGAVPPEGEAFDEFTSKVTRDERSIVSNGNEVGNLHEIERQQLAASHGEQVSNPPTIDRPPVVNGE